MNHYMLNTISHSAHKHTSIMFSLLSMLCVTSVIDDVLEFMLLRLLMPSGFLAMLSRYSCDDDAKLQLSALPLPSLSLLPQSSSSSNQDSPPAGWGGAVLVPGRDVLADVGSGIWLLRQVQLEVEWDQEGVGTGKCAK